MQQTYARGDVNILSPVMTDPDEANSNGTAHDRQQRVAGLLELENDDVICCFCLIFQKVSLECNGDGNILVHD